MRIGYARVSSREQGEDGSLEQQKDRLRRAGAGEILIDIESGTKDERPNYQRLQELIVIHGDRLTVIVTRLDRLTRSLVELRRFIALIEKTGSNLIALDDHLDLTSSVGKFQLNMLGALAEMESDRMGERIRHGHAYRRSQGKPSPGFAPFGYKRDEDGDRLIGDREKVICFEGREWSRWELGRLRIELIKESGSLYGAVKEYNKRLGLGLIVKGHSRGKLRVSNKGLGVWVSNPTLRGILEYGRVSGPHQEIVGKVEALMSPQEWAEIQEILNSNNKKRGQSGGRSLLFAGLVRCGECRGMFGGRSWATKAGESTHYRCQRRIIYGGDGACPNSDLINQTTLLDAIGKELVKKASEIWSTEAVSLPTNHPADPEQSKLREQIITLKRMEYNPVIQQAIADLERELMKMVNQQAIEDQGLRTRREEVKEVFADPNFWEWLAQRPDDMRKTLRRYVKTIWVKNGLIERIELTI